MGAVWLAIFEMGLSTGLDRLVGEPRPSPIASAEKRCWVSSDEFLLEVVDWDHRFKLPRPSLMPSFRWLVDCSVLSPWPKMVGVWVPDLEVFRVISDPVSVGLSTNEVCERREGILLAVGTMSGEPVLDGRF